MIAAFSQVVESIIYGGHTMSGQSAVLIDVDRCVKDQIIRLREEHPEKDDSDILFQAGATEADLNKWTQDDPAFRIRWQTAQRFAIYLLRDIASNPEGAAS